MWQSGGNCLQIFSVCFELPAHLEFNPEKLKIFVKCDLREFKSRAIFFGTFCVLLAFNAQFKNPLDFIWQQTSSAAIRTIDLPAIFFLIKLKAWIIHRDRFVRRVCLAFVFLSFDFFCGIVRATPYSVANSLSSLLKYTVYMPIKQKTASKIALSFTIRIWPLTVWYSPTYVPHKYNNRLHCHHILLVYTWATLHFCFLFRCQTFRRANKEIHVAITTCFSNT